MKLKPLLITIFSILSISVFSQKKMTKAELDASKIIQMGNSVIDLGNLYSQTLESYQNMLSGVHTNLQRVSKNPNLTPYAVRCENFSTQSRQQIAYATALKAAPLFEEKNDVEKYVSEGQTSIQEISKWCATLSAYVSNKEYKTDADFAKYNEIRNNLDSAIEQASASWSKASELASAAGNKAELILLESSPIASFVIPMKTDLTSLNAIFNMFKSKTPDTGAIKSALNALTESIDQHKDISKKDTSKLKDIYYKEVYETFYRDCLSAVKSLNTVTERLLEAEPDVRNIESWFGSASGAYNKAIERYNTFVSQ